MWQEDGSSSRPPLRQRALRAFRGELEQLRHGLDVPIGVIGRRMAEIVAELDHLTVRIEPPAIPTHDRPDGEGVPQIMDARTTPMPAVALRLAQADPLGDEREVVAR